jgi:Predicted transcriptional regulator
MTFAIASIPTRLYEHLDNDPMLEMKGYVSHRRGEGKTHVYFPVVDAQTAGESVLGRVLDKIYGGSPIKLLTQLVEQHRLSDKELSRMRELLKKKPAKKR